MYRLLLLITLCLNMNLPFLAQASEPAGEIFEVVGDATVRDNKAKRQAAEPGMDVESGYMVKTKKSSTVAIELLDSSIFRIAAKSTLVIDDFVLDGTSNRSMKARMLGGAMQYISKSSGFLKDDRKVMLANVSLAIRGTNFIGIIGPRIQVVLLEGNIVISARSNNIELNQRGQTVFLDRTGKFDEAFLLPDDELTQLGEQLGWDIQLPPRATSGSRSSGIGRRVGCALVNATIICG